MAQPFTKKTVIEVSAERGLPKKMRFEGYAKELSRSRKILKNH